MSSIAYSERRQRAYFKCARELRATACEILDDVQTETELRGETAPWAFRLAVKVAKDATEIENKGHEQIVADNRVYAPNHRSGRTYHDSIEAFQGRLAAARRLSAVEANELCKGWVAPHPAAHIG